MDAIRERVRAMIKDSALKQSEVAGRAGLTESQLSKSLSGSRQFSAVELAKIAEALNVSLHWLVTGQDDPMEVRIAARHAFDDVKGTYDAPAAEKDDKTLQSIALLYKQAYQ